MKMLVPLVMTGLMLLVFPGMALAGVIWNNGSVTGEGGQCDFTGNACSGGDTGWTIFDDFNLSDEEIVSGLTYDSYFSDGSTSDYVSTKWEIYDGDPLVFGSDALVASGNSVATLSSDSDEAITFTVSGLSVDLTAGTYWLGYENVLESDGAETLDALSNGSALPGFEQESDDLNPENQFTYDTGNTVFTIEGSATPEPASLLLAALAGFACAAKLKWKQVAIKRQAERDRCWKRLHFRRIEGRL